MMWDAEPGGSTIKLHINKIELAEKQPQTVAEFQGKTKLVFEDVTEIPHKVVEQLQLSENTIPAGAYKLSQTQLEYIIVFTF